MACQSDPQTHSSVFRCPQEDLSKTDGDAWRDVRTTNASRTRRLLAAFALAACFPVAALPVPAARGEGGARAQPGTEDGRGVVSSSEALTLAARGEGGATIVIAGKASPLEEYAAQELSDWTTQMTGVRLRIVRDAGALPARAIVLGETRHSAALLGARTNAEALAPLGTDGFRLAVRGSRLVAFGSRRRGALYAVYEILERFGGIAWLASWHADVPERERFEIPSALDETSTPAFAVREPFWHDVEKHPAFAARLRANALSWCDGRLGSLGIGEFRFGGRLGPCHTFDTLCPPERHFDAHPEWFSEVRGRRLKTRTQLCLTNPEVLEFVTSNVLAEIRRDPEAKYFGVSPNDWFNNCTCARCKAVDDEEGSPSGTLIRFVNAVAERVERVYPDKVIETLAYRYTRRPPGKTRVRRNVMPCLCTIEADFFRPIRESLKPSTREFTEFFRAWSAQTDRLFVWDYATNFRHYLLPFANVRAMRENFRFFRENGVTRLFEQGSYSGGHGDFAELKAYLAAKWMWNPDLPREPLLRRFFEGYFGKAAPYARAYFDALYEREAEWEKGGAHPLTICIEPSESCLDKTFLAKAAVWWKKAEEAVRGENSAYAYNVRMAALGIDYARLHREARVLYATRDPARHTAHFDTAAAARRLLESAREGGVRFCEGAGQNAAEEMRFAFLAAAKDPKPSDVARGPISLFGINGNGKRVPLADAADGYAVALTNAHHEWSGFFPLDALAYDAGAKYRVRFRLRVVRAAGAADGNVFSAGVYDPKARQARAPTMHINGESVPGPGWFWCETAPFEPNDVSYIWFSPGVFDRKRFLENPACTTTYVDFFEIVRAP